MTSISPIIPALFLVLLASYYSQNYAGILASPLDVEKELIRYFPDIQQKNLGLTLKYQDSLLETKITIESDGDLRVSSW